MESAIETLTENWEALSGALLALFTALATVIGLLKGKDPKGPKGPSAGALVLCLLASGGLVACGAVKQRVKHAARCLTAPAPDLLNAVTAEVLSGLGRQVDEPFMDAMRGLAHNYGMHAVRCALKSVSGLVHDDDDGGAEGMSDAEARCEDALRRLPE